MTMRRKIIPSLSCAYEKFTLPCHLLLDEGKKWDSFGHFQRGEQCLLIVEMPDPFRGPGISNFSGFFPAISQLAGRESPDPRC